MLISVEKLHDIPMPITGYRITATSAMDIVLVARNAINQASS